MPLIFSMMKKMQKASQKNKALSKAMSFLEVIVAMAIVIVVFAAIVPQLRAVRNSWASARASAELVQNGQALMNHTTCQLSQAVQIFSVSSPNETLGYIEFLGSNGNILRYDVADNNYVWFGLLGDLSDLAGPVSSLRFICCDAYDFSTPITDVNSIRFVKTVVTTTDPTGTIDDKTFTNNIYIRTSPVSWASGDPNVLTVGTSYWIDSGAVEIAMHRIDQNHYLLAYGDLAAVVLTVDPDTGLVYRNERFYPAVDARRYPALCKIDDTHYLRAYEFEAQLGGAAVLTVNTADWTLTEGPHHEYNSVKAIWPALSRINSTHYLCVYESTDDDGWAVVLTVDPNDWTISHGVPFEYDNSSAIQANLERLDDNHHLCVYRSYNGKAVVLTVGTGSDFIVVRARGEVGDEHIKLTVGGSEIADWTVTTSYQNYLVSNSGTGGVNVCFDNDDAGGRDVQVDYIQVNGTVRQAEDQSYNTGVWQDSSCGGSYSEWLHCNGCIGFGDASGSGGWTITQENTIDLEFFNWYRHGLCRIDSRHFLCTYNNLDNVNTIVLTVDPNTWSISDTSPFGVVPYESGRPCVVWLDSTNYVCAYRYRDGGPASGGYVVPLRVENGSWTFSKGAEVQMNTGTQCKSVVCRIDADRVFCVYVTETMDMYGVVVDYGEQVLP